MAYIWEIRSPDGGMLGLEVARAITDPCDEVLGHAFPEKVDVTVREGDRVVAQGSGLTAEGSTPMARLVLAGGTVVRTQVWPTDVDNGKPVILPGGEVGVLTAWWNAADGSEWRWSVEFYNHV